MPIKIPNGLPAERTLAEENIFVMHENRAAAQDIRVVAVGTVHVAIRREHHRARLARIIQKRCFAKSRDQHGPLRLSFARLTCCKRRLPGTGAAEKGAHPPPVSAVGKRVRMVTLVFSPVRRDRQITNFWRIMYSSRLPGL